MAHPASMPSIQARRGRRQGGEEDSNRTGNPGTRMAMADNAAHMTNSLRYSRYWQNESSPRVRIARAESDASFCDARTRSCAPHMQRARFTDDQNQMETGLNNNMAERPFASRGPSGRAHNER